MTAGFGDTARLSQSCLRILLRDSVHQAGQDVGSSHDDEEDGDAVSAGWPGGTGFDPAERIYGIPAASVPEQPIFYPVLTEEYAVKIARDWNVPASGAGYVTRFAVLPSFLDAFEVHSAGGAAYQEYWIPADDLPAFNAATVGRISVIAAFHRTVTG